MDNKYAQPIYTNRADINIEDFDVADMIVVKQKLHQDQEAEFHIDVYLKSKRDSTTKVVKMPYKPDKDSEKFSYERDIQNNSNYDLIYKLLQHPYLSRSDDNFIKKQNRKIVRNTIVIGGASGITLGSMEYFGKLGISNYRYLGLLLGPIGFMWLTYKVEKYKLVQNLKNQQLDTKYNIPYQ